MKAARFEYMFILASVFWTHDTFLAKVYQIHCTDRRVLKEEFCLDMFLKYLVPDEVLLLFIFGCDLNI